MEDRDALRRLMVRALEAEGWIARSAATVAEARREITGSVPVDLVLTDLRLPDGDGLDVLRLAAGRRPAPPVLMLTAFGSIETAVDAMKLGAADFLEKPVEIDDLVTRVRGLLRPEADAAIPAFQPPGDAPAIIGSHPRLRAALRLLQRVAPTESTVLVTGESGTGKELFARAIHALSKRTGAPFVAVNCAAIPEALMENELFGHEKGAFTGADRRQAGRFEQAHRGTLFLDEVGELKLEVQAKVLRAVEERRFERVGGAETFEADVRVVAATNRDLHAMAADGTFRRDLLYRLDVFPIELPSLADRRSDIPPLVRHLASRLAKRLDRRPPRFDRDVLERLAEEPWPGNVRQLANVLERLLILCDGDPTLTDVERLLRRAGGDEPSALDEVEELRDALRRTDGDKRRAAELLGVSYRTLQRRVRRHDLEGFPHYCP
ncbi:MAG: sigma-54 dependent transcriptional regulator [Acidobacteriota bacterium]